MLEQGPIVILLWSTFVATLGYLLLRVLDRWFGRQVDPRVMHGIWLLLVLRMIVPLRAPDWFAFALSQTWVTVLVSIWAAGFLVMFFLRLWQGYCLRREILQQEVTLPEWLHRDFIDIRKKMRIGTRPVLMVTGSHYGPLLSGILRPLIAFPFSFIKQFDDQASEQDEQDELRRSVCHVLRHELCHLRGGDLWLGWLWVIARSVHWFNPLLAGAGNSLRIWRELSCDLRTMQSFEEPDPSKRAREYLDYAQMLLNTAALSSNLYRPLDAAASVVEPFNEIERRISMITHTPFSLARRLTANSTALIAVLLLMFFSCTGLWSAQNQAVAATGMMPSKATSKTTNVAADMTSTSNATDQTNEIAKETSTSNSSEPTKSKDLKFQILTYVDNSNESMRSIAGSGHAVLFEKRPESGKYLECLAMFCGRYGMPQAPREDFYLYIMKEKKQKKPIDLSAENLQVLAEIPVPYSKVKRSDLKWHQFSTPSIELPKGRFIVAASFNPHQTKGIYLGLDEDADTDACKSLVGLPENGFSSFNGKGQWMIGAKLFPKPTKGKRVVRLSDVKSAEKEIEKSKYKMVSFCGKKSDGRNSYGGAGPVVMIPLEESLDMPKEKLQRCKLAGLCLWASYYGRVSEAKASKVDVVITDSEGEVLYRQPFSYSKFGNTPRSVNLIFPKPVALKDYIQEDGKLYVGIDPKANQRKGVFFHYTKTEEPKGATPFEEIEEGESHSGVLVPDRKISPANDREWMIQCFFVPPTEEKEE